MEIMVAVVVVVKNEAAEIMKIDTTSTDNRAHALSIQMWFQARRFKNIYEKLLECIASCMKRFFKRRLCNGILKFAKLDIQLAL